MSTQTFVAFQDDRHGSYLAVVVCFAILSLIAVDIVWMRILWVMANALFKRGDMRKINRERLIFSSQLGAYVISLLIGNLLSGIGFVMNVAWLKENGITIGSFCSIQGGVSQIADVATAYFTAAIAVHTFNTLVLHNRLPSWFCLVAIIFGWVAAGLSGIIPSNADLKSGPFYSTDDVSCGISLFYPVLQTVLHLVPVLVAALVSVLFYSLVFLIIRGTLIIRGGLKLNLDLEARRLTMHDNFGYPNFIAAIARSMLWYPVAYVTLMFPHIIVCLLEASGSDVPFLWKIVADVGAATIGLGNVLVFYNTIRIMGPAFSRPSQTDSEKSESFVSPHKREDSPVDIAPPVAAFIPAKSFPPPRSGSNTPRESMDARPRPSLTHYRQQSSGSESTHHLLHARSESTWSSDSNDVTKSMGAALARTITPPGELSRMISEPAPAVRKVSINERSLPAPRRKERSAVLRRPTLATIPSPSLDNTMLSAVPLKTGAPPDNQVSQRNSFINMYGSRSPAVSSSNSRTSGPAMMLNDAAVPTFASPQSGSSVDYTSDSSDSDVPRSAFGDVTMRPERSRSFRNEVEERLSTADAPESGGLSSLAWATLVADAATSNGGVNGVAQLKATRRRSKSMESLTVPSALQARSPMSATLRRERAEAVPPPPRSAVPMRMDSQANFRNGPSRTPTLRTTATMLRASDGVYRSRTYQ